MRCSPTCQVAVWKSWNRISSAAPRLCLGAGSRAGCHTVDGAGTQRYHATLWCRRGTWGGTIWRMGWLRDLVFRTHVDAGRVQQEEARRGSRIAGGESSGRATAPLPLPKLWFHIVIINVRCESESKLLLINGAKARSFTGFGVLCACWWTIGL